MSIILYRVDDRLIHGQVTVGWARALEPDMIIIVDDEVASNPWEVKLFQSAVPEPLKVVVWSMADALKELPGAQETDKIGFVLTRDLKAMAALIEGGTEIPSINLGGLHFSHNKTQILPYISFSSEDIDILKILKDRNVEIDVRDVPTTEKKDIIELLKEKGLY